MAQDKGGTERAGYPIALRVFGVLCAIGGAGFVALFVTQIVRAVLLGQTGAVAPDYSQYSTATLIIYVILMAITFCLSAMFLLLGLRMLRGQRRRIATISYIMVAFMLASILCSIMLDGLDLSVLPTLIAIVLLVTLASYTDPSLAAERLLRQSLADLSAKQAAEAATGGLDTTGKGFIALNFFNLFWVFVTCSMVGFVVETLYHYAVYDPGDWENRAGMLYGPFSPIYGIGGVLMTVSLNRIHKSNVALIFVVSALIGGSFEYLASWFLQFAFGIKAWDYTGELGSIGGRTCVSFMVMWGVLGVTWIKTLLPGILRLVNLIPWNLRYAVTGVASVALFADATLTLMALDCWYQRLADPSMVASSAIDMFCAEHYGNDFMQGHFECMTLTPSDAVRIRG